MGEVHSKVAEYESRLAEIYLAQNRLEAGLIAQAENRLADLGTMVSTQ